MTRTVAPHAEETRRRLVVAGIELFGRHGFDTVTTRQLADAAGVNQAAIPYHFGGKEGVYLAAAEHVVAISGERIRPLLATIRQRLADRPDRQAVGALLHEATLVIARTAFESGHHAVWLAFLSREQFHPSAAFERLYEEFAGPVHAVVAELLGRLTGQAAKTAETILLAHAYLGQVIGFASARGTLIRRLGRKGELTQKDMETIVAAIDRFSRIVIRGMTTAEA